MSSDSIVVMDSGVAWPSWVDEGNESNVAVLARQADETPRAFERRAAQWVEDALAIVQPRRGVLVARPYAEPWTRSVLASLARAVHAARGRTVILASSGDHAEQRHLAGLLRELSRELEQEGVDTPLQLRVYAPAAAGADRQGLARVA